MRRTLSELNRFLVEPSSFAISLLTTILLGASPSIAHSEDLAPEQFARLMESSLDVFKDITLVFEGRVNYPDQPEMPDAIYQGLYSFREDGATLLDVYARSERNDLPLSRSTAAILNGELEEYTQTPDEGFVGREKAPGGAGVLNRPMSAERILFLFYFKTLRNLNNYKYEFFGYKTIQNSLCANVRISLFPRSALERMDPVRHQHLDFCVDLDRGGHPIRIERVRGGELQGRSTIESIQRIQLDGGEFVWLPTSGKFEQFTPLSSLGSSASRSPTVVETYSVVNGSVRINQNLPDSYFSARREDANFYDPTLRDLQAELEAAKGDMVATDPRSVQRVLDERLAQAEEQAEQLDASLPDASWTWLGVLQVVMGLIGISLLLGLIVYRWTH